MKGKLCCQLCFMFCQQPNPSSSAVTSKIPDLHSGLHYLETNTNAFGLYGLNTGLRFDVLPFFLLKFFWTLFMTDDISKCLYCTEVFSSPQKGRGGRGRAFPQWRRRARTFSSLRNSVVCYGTAS